MLKGILLSVFKECFREKTDLRDESIHDFISRRFNSSVADNIVSAMVHGIYAGDSHKLSVKVCILFHFNYLLVHISGTLGCRTKVRVCGRRHFSSTQITH